MSSHGCCNSTRERIRCEESNYRAENAGAEAGDIEVKVGGSVENAENAIVTFIIRQIIHFPRHLLK